MRDRRFLASNTENPRGTPNTPQRQSRRGGLFSEDSSRTSSPGTASQVGPSRFRVFVPYNPASDACPGVLEQDKKVRRGGAPEAVGPKNGRKATKEQVWLAASPLEHARALSNTATGDRTYTFHTRGYGWPYSLPPLDVTSRFLPT